MALVCGIDYEVAAGDATAITIDGVAITVASPATLIRTKNTVRPSDAADLQSRGIDPGGSSRILTRTFLADETTSASR
jgi:hypothetical protein